jgi:hypothetical protein
VYIPTLPNPPIIPYSSLFSDYTQIFFCRKMSVLNIHSTDLLQAVIENRIQVSSGKVILSELPLANSLVGYRTWYLLTKHKVFIINFAVKALPCELTLAALVITVVSKFVYHKCFLLYFSIDNMVTGTGNLIFSIQVFSIGNQPRYL